MLDEQENWLSRAVTVDKALDNNAAVFAAVPLFVANANNIKTKIAEINGIVQLQITPITGSAVDKSNFEDAAIKAVMELVGPMKAWSLSTNDMTFHNSVDFTSSKLDKTRDTTLSNTLIMLNGKANTNIAALGGVGLLAGMVTTSITATTTYTGFLSSPRTAIGVKASATAALVPAFVTLNSYMEILRQQIELYKNSNATFYSIMKSALVIVDTSGAGGSIGGGTGGGTGGGDPEIIGALVMAGATANISYSSSINGNTTLKLKSTGGETMRFYFAATSGGTVGAVFMDVTAGGEEDVIASDIGYDVSKIFLNVKDLGAGPGSYEVTIG